MIKLQYILILKAKFLCSLVLIFNYHDVINNNLYYLTVEMMFLFS